MNHVVNIYEQGPPDVLKYEPASEPTPKPGELVVRQTAIGVNYLDIYFRNGHFGAPGSPFINGFEGAGHVVSVGEGVVGFEPGDRIGYQLSMGAYAELRSVPADRCIKLPDFISDELAAAILLKGMTAEYLVNRVRRVGPEHTILVHAASGGVGSMIVQWASALGATVIATVGSEAKALTAKQNGAAHSINYSEEGFVSKVNDITDGNGVDIAYDGVGAATFEKTFGCLGHFGENILFGWASGKVGKVDVDALNGKSHRISNPSLGHYTGTRERLEASAETLFAAIRDKLIKPEVGQRYDLAQVEQAHSDLENRRTSGSAILIP